MTTTLPLLRRAVAQYRDRTCSRPMLRRASASAYHYPFPARYPQQQPLLQLYHLNVNVNQHRGFATKRQQRTASASPSSALENPPDENTSTSTSTSTTKGQAGAGADAEAWTEQGASTPVEARPTAVPKKSQRHSLDAPQWSPSLSASLQSSQSSQSPLIRTDLDLHRQLMDASFRLDTAMSTSNSATSSATGGIDLEQAFHPGLFDPAIHLPSAPTDWTGYEAATPLTEHLIAQIGVSGQPMSTAAFMQAALTHPEFGYYVRAGQKRAGVNGTSDHVDDFDDDDYDYDETNIATSSPSSSSSSSNSQNNNEAHAQQTQSIIGPSGDFVTAPEVSSIFTETLGIWLYTQHQLLSSHNSNGAHESWQWLECGPGAGTLTADLVSFVQQLPDFGTSLKHVHLVEASPVLRQVQQERLKSIESPEIKFQFDAVNSKGTSANKQKNPDVDTNDGNHEAEAEAVDEKAIIVRWHDSLAAFQAWQIEHDVSLPIFTVWQEFLDALPVYAFEKTSDGWRERMVDVAMRADLMDEDDLRKEEEAMQKSPLAHVKKPRFRLVLAPEVTPALKTLLQVDEQGNLPNKDIDAAPVGSVIEVNPEGILLAQDLAKLLEKQGGAGLIIDYGQEGSTDSIRAFRKHQQVHFLSRPGQVDVTADVDFAAIRHAVNALGLPQVQAFGPTTQGQFLVTMGIQERVVQLIESDHTTEEEAENLFEALKRLAGPEEMGVRYKVLAIARKKEGIFEPPGFDYLTKQG
jgi:NADH dehydrogenase [ubiquinone] 1 alpha subcomplex assembly factor 7